MSDTAASRPGLRRRIGALFAALVAANAAAWVWAVLVFHGHPALLATCLVAYGFGLRHAVDVDHIAAIDNVVRKLVQRGGRPIGVGLFFSLGHSTVVIFASTAIALTASALQDRFAAAKFFGGITGTLVSGLFLIAIAAANMPILLDLWRRVRGARPGDELDGRVVALGGFFTRVFRPAFTLIGKSWHVYPLGVLFGMGFDTATEIGLLGVSAASATKGLPIWSILVFPALFTAGMSLVDTADGVLMLGAYGWAVRTPFRTLYYNLAITTLSIVSAAAIGGIEMLGLLRDRFGLDDAFWRSIGVLNDHFASIGLAVIGLVCTGWLACVALHRLRADDLTEVGS